MKVLFVGPSLHGSATAGRYFPGTDILCLPPAQQGDIARAVLRGATMIGLVDGRYEDVAAPWHKEILYGLDQGLRLFGAASMGALRAAECAPFGMEPVGAVARRYIDGGITDDAAVAQVHGPEELGFVPLSEALVNVEATLEAATASAAVPDAEAARLAAAARRIFFKVRTWHSIVEEAGFSTGYGENLVRGLEACRRDVKQEDARALVEVMRATPSGRRPRQTSWRFKEPTAWRRFLSELRDGEG